MVERVEWGAQEGWRGGVGWSGCSGVEDVEGMDVGGGWWRGWV